MDISKGIEWLSIKTVNGDLEVFREMNLCAALKMYLEITISRKQQV